MSCIEVVVGVLTIKCVFKELKDCLSCFLKKFNLCYKEISKVFQGSLGGFKCFKEGVEKLVSQVFQDCLKEVSKVLKGSFVLCCMALIAASRAERGLFFCKLLQVCWRGGNLIMEKLQLTMPTNQAEVWLSLVTWKTKLLYLCQNLLCSARLILSENYYSCRVCPGQVGQVTG